ncbi:hypothetical protein WG68_00655 [Arsukibacterium ikkense]|uniref:DUF2796 domain-containing protein n=1 Tax=Arsukibacterium ikkense TaxID=336831 RepID=A0A0M2V9D2_9GAMM|nr:DUF2796 domain-containing protein [Arsukibacterium ikkense]KKO47196.1 hypothetical protein WG68_00655 [Arsukibacterium ikkense]
MSTLRLSAVVCSYLNVMAIGALLLAAPASVAQQHADDHHHKAQPEHQHDHKHKHDQAPQQHQHEHDHEHDDFSSPGAHVHGQATLTIVLEGNEAMLALQSAAYNIVGFEHTPTTAEQRQEIAVALDVLRQGKWFAINSQAGCDLTDADANTDLTSSVATQHADFYANISLICQQPARFNELTVTLFNLVPSLERVSVQWVINGQQGATNLSLANNKVAF